MKYEHISMSNENYKHVYKNTPLLELILDERATTI